MIDNALKQRAQTVGTAQTVAMVCIAVLLVMAAAVAVLPVVSIYSMPDGEQDMWRHTASATRTPRARHPVGIIRRLCPVAENVTCPPVQNVTCPPVQTVTCPPVQNVTCPPVQNVTCPPVQNVTCPPVQNITCPPVQNVTCPPAAESPSNSAGEGFDFNLTGSRWHPSLLEDSNQSREFATSRRGHQGIQTGQAVHTHAVTFGTTFYAAC